MSEFLWVAAAAISFWLTGAAILQVALWLFRDAESLPTAEFHGISLLLGIGGVGWLMFAWSLCGAPLGPPASLGIGLIGSLAGGWAIRHRRSLLPGDFPESSPWTRCGYLALVLLWVSLGLQAVLTPQRLWDERAIFGIKSKVLFEDRDINSPILLHPRFSQYHPRYPLLLPLAETYVYGWLNRVDDRWGKLIPPLLAGGLWLSFAGVLSRLSGADRGVLWALLLATVPALTVWEYGFLTAQADAVLGAFHGLAVLSIWEGLSHRSKPSQAPRTTRPWIIGGLAAGCAVFVKDEGFAFLLVDGAALVLLVVVGRGGWRGVLLFLAMAVGLTGFWFLHRRGLPTTTEMSYFSRLNWDGLRHGASTLLWSVPHLGQRMFREGLTWGLTWWGVVVAMLLRPARMLSPAQMFLLLDILGALAALLVAGMLAPTPVEEHLGGSAHRFLLQIAPVGVLLIAGQLCEKRVHGIGKSAGRESSTALFSTRQQG